MTNTVAVKIERLDHAPVEPLAYAHEGDAGFDFRAAIGDQVLIGPGDRALIPTGYRFAVPEGYELQVRPRSGMCWKAGMTVLNAPGTVDAGYRGEVYVMLLNTSDEPYVLDPGTRIAQGVIAPVLRAEFVEEPLDDTERGEGGFGSTGTN